MVLDLDHVVLNISKMANKTSVSYAVDEVGNDTFRSNWTQLKTMCVEDQPGEIRIDDMVVYGFLLSFFAVIGCPLNMLTILGFARVKNTSSHTFLLQMLAGADGLFMLMVFIDHSLRHWYELFGNLITWDWLFFHNMFVIRNFTSIAADLAVWMVVLVTLDRYIAIYHPTRATRYCQIKPACIAVVAVCIYVLAFNFHSFFVWTIRTTGNSTCHGHDIIHNTSRGYDLAYNTADSFINIGLPIVLVIFMDARMIIALRRSKKRMGKRKDEASSTATVVLVVLATTFVLCEIPSATEIFMRVFGANSYHYELSFVSIVFLDLNSFINFFIYIMIGKTFRDALKTTLNDIFCCGKKKHPVYSKASCTAATTSIA